VTDPAKALREAEREYKSARICWADSLNAKSARGEDAATARLDAAYDALIAAVRREARDGGRP
jgi:hypothetical protein